MYSAIMMCVMTSSSVRTTLRIPGAWADPRELLDRIPTEFRLTPENLLLPDGTEIEFTPLQPDAQFAQIFRSSCRQPATDAELAVLARYTVNIGLSGCGGSLDSALKLMQAVAANVQGVGAG